ncbi:Alpha/Beta hydrolase protein [Aspergillus pseudodeflectus]|uniref:Alpha/Beta hydrolase protein n=1 Tax=Aspergillus pseudodeflectus TaxID=176178 RepID=A0ABR4KNZ2_9EURO
MLFSKLAIWLALIGTTIARFCQNQTIQLRVTARNGVFDNLITPSTDLEAINFALAASKQRSNGTAQALTGYHTITGTYNLSTQYCTPDDRANAPNSTEPPILQILTHGIGFDKTYWDLAYNDYNYSYVKYSLDHGYHTLSYDRLGIGASSHGDPRNEIQTSLEVAALAQLTQLVRNGSFPGMSTRPRHVVHVGHSFGSVQTYEFTAMYPALSDAIVLTGFSTNLSFFDLFLAGGNWHQAYLATQGQQQQQPQPGEASGSAYPPGYLATGNAAADQYLFCFAPQFDPGLLAYVESVKQPVSIGELLTIGASLPRVNTFQGPALVISGSNDVPFCGGDCSNVLSSTRDALPQASPFMPHIEPVTGHGINVHYTAVNVYERILSFLETSGLAP